MNFEGSFKNKSFSWRMSQNHKVEKFWVIYELCLQTPEIYVGTHYNGHDILKLLVSESIKCCLRQCVQCEPHNSPYILSFQFDEHYDGINQLKGQILERSSLYCQANLGNARILSAPRTKTPPLHLPTSSKNKMRRRIKIFVELLAFFLFFYPIC